MDLTAEFVAPTIEWYALAPYIVLLSGALVLLLVGALTPRWPRGWYAVLTATTAGAAAVIAALQFAALADEAPRTLVKGALSHDRFGLLALIAVCVAVVFTSMTTSDAADGGASPNSDSLEPY